MIDLVRGSVVSSNREDEGIEELRGEEREYALQLLEALKQRRGVA